MADKSSRENFAEMRKRPLREFLPYLWEYYRWPVFWVVFFVGCFVSLVLSIVNQKDTVLSVLMLNCRPYPESDFYVVDFAEQAEIDLDAYAMDFNTSLRIGQTLDEDAMNASQYILTHIAAGQLDVAVMDTRNFTGYADILFQDLREHLTDTQLAELSGRLFYRPGDGSDADLYDPTDPESMPSPVPIGIILSDCEDFHEAFYYENQDAVAGICVNALNPQNGVKFLTYISE